MRRLQANTDKVNNQKIRYMQDLHYGHVESAGVRQLKAKEQAERLKVVEEKGFRKSKCVTIRGIERRIKFIATNGMLVLENWKEVDPRKL